MPDDAPSRSPHSLEYFGEDRDYFWNDDYLDLLAARLNFAQVRSVLDVGCGIGHWTRLVAKRLADGVSVTGIDRETAHITEFRRAMAPLAARGITVAGIRANAYALPVPTGTADLVTCQTLLLHLQDPSRALAEMVRAARPGGLVLCVEPNNLVARLPVTCLMHGMEDDAVVRLAEFAFRHTIGRTRRGLGDECIGERLPGLFAAAGLGEIRVWLCDKAAALFPPYDSREQAAAFGASSRWRREGTGPFDMDEMRRNVLAGGGDADFFARAWSDHLRLDDMTAAAAENGTWHTAGGALLYVVAGRKPG
ncbi:class I SAM-dependent methyltransferase [Methylobacterium variabile]|jgi:SAM-dependent methyltransferase|uniref:class I SAM-dependent methyltransferase n=1 Tax=Methylobacterium variabile TaxID=298794 RepID=UPI00069E4BA7|nr:methyltransferase domain-containing protein [Methylobacterium variabile]